MCIQTECQESTINVAFTAMYQYKADFEHSAVTLAELCQNTTDLAE